MSFAEKMKNVLDLASTIAVVVAAGTLLWTVFVRQPAASAARPSIERVTGLRIDATKITNVRGSGRLALIEFSDFQCPFCAAYSRKTLPTIERDLIETGKLRYAALNYPLETIHPLAIQAGEASECAARQDKFWPMHERLFAEPTALTAADLRRDAHALGLNQEQFETCLSGHLALEKVRSDKEEGRRLGVKATPTFLIGVTRPDGGINIAKRIRGAITSDELARQVAEVEAEFR